MQLSSIIHKNATCSTKDLAPLLLHSQIKHHHIGLSRVCHSGSNLHVLSLDFRFHAALPYVRQETSKLNYAVSSRILV